MFDFGWRINHVKRFNIIVSTKFVILEFQFRKGVGPPFVRPLFPHTGFVCIVHDPQQSSNSFRKHNSLVGHCEARTAFLHIVFVYYLETVRHRTQHRSLPVHTFRTLTFHHLRPERHTVCANTTIRDSCSLLHACAVRSGGATWSKVE
jgi:hypothetical protein